MTMNNHSSRPDWTFAVCDSLETVLADRAPRHIDAAIPLVGYRGQSVSLQLAFLPPAVASTAQLSDILVSARTTAAGSFRFGKVELVPCSLLAWDDHDDDYLVDKPGLYPDPVRPLPDGLVTALPASWGAVWVEFVVDRDAALSSGPIELQVHRVEDGSPAELLFEAEVPLQVVPHQLPELSLTNTHWFHCDGLARLYDVDVFSDGHWAVIEAQLEAAVAVGINSVLTPCWTPPLDTAVGTNRLMTQLIGISDSGDGNYRFDFGDLGRWLELCSRHGLRAIEISHLFTQWGAEATPAIWIERHGQLERRFGWDVAATDPSYRAFLEQLIPALRAFLEENWSGRVIFHISDEPEARQLTAYRAARGVVADLLEGAIVADAMSDFELYSAGAVPLPIVATNAAQPFLDAGVEPLWLYYCVAQNRDVANRFIGMPAYRNRVLGTQLWLAGAAGFLHWGFNFYNTQFSTRTVDPFTDTCAGGGFLAGDAFLVYPGPDGTPWHSTRSLVFREAMDDHRALQLLELRCGRDTALEIADPTITLTSYPREPDHYRRVWAEVAKAIIATL